jgi:hypothetical protein
MALAGRKNQEIGRKIKERYSPASFFLQIRLLVALHAKRTLFCGKEGKN